MKGEHSIRMLCDLLGVSPSGYYGSRADRPSSRQREDEALTKQIAAAHRASRGSYGAPRIVVDLREAGTCTSKRRCARLMKAQGLRGRKKHSRKPRTTDSRHSQPVAPNLLAKRPAPTGPNQSWLTDITCIATAEGWLYLAAIVDLGTRRIVGWALSERMTAKLVCDALQMAYWRRRPAPGHRPR